MISKSIITLLFLVSATCSNGQKILLDSMWFDAANSFRDYKVWLPADYDQELNYTTIYCFDGEMLFDILVANVAIYSDPSVGKIPPSIVVGVFFNDRNEDMGINWDTGRLNEKGAAFKEFIEFDLVPTIQNKFSTSAYKTVVGHSNSTTYCYSFLWDDKLLFDAFLTLSQFELETDVFNFSNLKNTDKNIDLVCITGNGDADYRVRSGHALERLLDSLNISSLNSTSIFLPSADHITMVPQGVPLGLEALFEPFSVEVELDSILHSDLFLNLEPKQIVDDILKEKAAKYDLDLMYNMYYLDLLFSLYVEKKDSVGISIATNTYAEMFKDSSEYFYEAQCLESMGAYYSAEKSYLNHVNYYSSPGYWAHMRLVWLYAYRLKVPKEAFEWCVKGFVQTSDVQFLHELEDVLIRYPMYQEEVRYRLNSLLNGSEEINFRKELEAVLQRIE